MFPCVGLSRGMSSIVTVGYRSRAVPPGVRREAI
jgi:hypothetical protein